MSNIVENKQIKISFDFDDTLCMLRGSGNPYSTFYDATPNNEMIDKFKKYQSKGVEIYIVSSRQRNKENRDEINSFCKHNGLNPIGIFLTNLDYKVETLLALNINIHYDDNLEEIEAIKKYAPDIKAIQVG